MNWILYIIMGTATQPSLQQLQTYRDEAVCRQSVKNLEEKAVKAVCIARETAKVTQ
jgi:hypothetical protein